MNKYIEILNQLIKELFPDADLETKSKLSRVFLAGMSNGKEFHEEFKDLKPQHKE